MILFSITEKNERNDKTDYTAEKKQNTKISKKLSYKGFSCFCLPNRSKTGIGEIMEHKIRQYKNNN